MPTITKKEIAERLGVSRSTVSHVLNNKPNTRISTKTRERVFKTARELGYVNDWLNQRIKVQNELKFVICGLEFSHPIFFKYLRTVQQIAKQNSYRLLYHEIPNSAEGVNELISTLNQSPVSGILLTGYLGPELIRKLKQVRTPFVCVGTYDIPDVTIVTYDSYQQGLLATEHLIKLGHKKIAFLTGDLEILDLKLQLQGYKDALEKHSIKYDIQLVQASEIEDGYALGSRLFNLGLSPTAICTANDMVAVGLLKLFINKGIRVPDQVSIVGAGDTDLAVHSHPALTSINLNEHNTVGKAMEMLIGHINNANLPPREIQTPVSLTVRESTASAATSDSFK